MVFAHKNSATAQDSRRRPSYRTLQRPIAHENSGCLRSPGRCLGQSDGASFDGWPGPHPIGSDTPLFRCALAPYPFRNGRQDALRWPARGLSLATKPLQSLLFRFRAYKQRHNLPTSLCDERSLIRSDRGGECKLSP